MCDDGLSHDEIKTEDIKMSKDPLEIMETGKKFFGWTLHWYKWKYQYQPADDKSNKWNVQLIF